MNDHMCRYLAPTRALLFLTLLLFSLLPPPWGSGVVRPLTCGALPEPTAPCRPARDTRKCVGIRIHRL